MKRRNFLKGLALAPMAAVVPMGLAAQSTKATILQQEMVRLLQERKFVLSSRRAGMSVAARLFAIDSMKRGYQTHYIGFKNTWEELNKDLVNDMAVSMIPQRGFLDMRSGGSLLTYNIDEPRSFSGITGVILVDGPDFMDSNAFTSLLARPRSHICGIGTPREEYKVYSNLWWVRDNIVRVATSEV